jgi:2-polyprenyl-3-methyl-5-hydroxy-6-metoxy-1,4-benzoquinol methylase
MTSSEMTIEEYAARTQQLYGDAVPRLLVELMRTTAWASFADIGCGDGALLGGLRQAGLLEGKRAFGVELSKTRVERARAASPFVQIIESDAAAIPQLETGSIDLVATTQVIEHVVDDTQMLRELRRIVSSDGLVYLSTVHKRPYGWYFYRCNGRWVLDPTHLREYTADEQLTGPAQAAGFEVIRNVKELFWFPLMDPVIKRALGGSGHKALTSPVVSVLRKVRIPIVGYYNWELVLKPR